MSFPHRLLAAICLSLPLATCTSTPVAPDAVHRVNPGSISYGTPLNDPGDVPSSGARSSEKLTQSFSLIGGRFSFTTESGDSLIGTYVGEASVANPGQDTGVLQMIVTSGTRGFAGAVGNMTGRLTGAFTRRDDFTLVVSGQIRTADGSDSPFHAPVRGSVALSCGASQRIVMSLTGTGTAGNAGKVAVNFSHELSNTTCFDN